MDRSTSPERGQPSNTRRETRQTHETSQERIERVRRGNMRNTITHHENRRANETIEERDRRLDDEREGLREQLKSATSIPEQQAIAFQYQKDYIQREKTVRGLENVEYLNYNQHQIEEY